MYNDYMYAVDRSDEYLAHYGIKGMKWGVQKAKESGNSRKLARQYKKAQKKLAKLEKRAANGSKYAKRAAALGAGAALAGGLAVQGTKGAAIGLHRAASLTGRAGKALSTAAAGAKWMGNSPVRAAAIKYGTRLSSANGVAGALGKAGGAVSKWGNENTIGQAAKTLGRQAYNAASQSDIAGGAVRAVNKGLLQTGHKQLVPQIDKLGGVSNNTFARIGAGAVGAGLGAAAGYNAYRAATTKKAAQKAQQFRSEMNKAFAGTQYANGGKGSSGGSKKRRRR